MYRYNYANQTSNGSVLVKRQLGTGKGMWALMTDK